MESLSGIGVQVFGLLRQVFTWPILTLDGGTFYPGSLGLAGSRFTSSDQSSGVANITDPPASGQRLVITDIRFSSDTTLRLDFIDQGNNNILFSEYVSANSGGQITLRGKVKLSTANVELGLQTSTAGNIAVTVSYYSEP